MTVLCDNTSRFPCLFLPFSPTRSQLCWYTVRWAMELAFFQVFYSADELLCSLLNKIELFSTADNARMGLTETKLAIIPGGGKTISVALGLYQCVSGGIFPGDQQW